MFGLLFRMRIEIKYLIVETKSHSYQDFDSSILHRDTIHFYSNAISTTVPTYQTCVNFYIIIAWVRFILFICIVPKKFSVPSIV